MSALIARALLHDEASSQPDAVNVAALRMAVAGARGGRHRPPLSTVVAADRIPLVEDSLEPDGCDELAATRLTA